jgi:hypothetical protein
MSKTYFAYAIVIYGWSMFVVVVFALMMLFALLLRKLIKYMDEEGTKESQDVKYPRDPI